MTYFDEEEFPSIAEKFYNDMSNLEDVRKFAELASISLVQDFIGDVLYTTYTFKDGSKFTSGDNGYVGMETF